MFLSNMRNKHKDVNMVKSVSECALILHDIRSVHNVGSLFRTADGAGVSRIILSGYTPTPLDRFGNARKDFCKVSLGAEESIPWEVVESLGSKLGSLKTEGYIIVMIEQHAISKSLFEWNPPTGSRLAIVLGNEVLGISEQTMGHADVVLEIPMLGKKESLNVSVAGGVALFELLK